MDAFLRRVMAIREREQEEAVVNRSLEELDPAAGVRRCATCRKRLKSSNKKGICFACRSAGISPPHDPQVHYRFRREAEAAGHDPEDLVYRFKESWLRRHRKRGAK